MKIPAKARDFAIQHGINLGRDHAGNYFIRHPKTLQVVMTTVSAKPTATQAIGMMRRYNRQVLIDTLSE